MLLAGEDYGPAPDLDHLNPELRAALTEWLCHLHDDVGFHGWRLDFVRGYAPKYVREYIAATVGTDVLNVGVSVHGSSSGGGSGGDAGSGNT